MWLPHQDKATLTVVYISKGWAEILLPLAKYIRRCHFGQNHTLVTVFRLALPGFIQSMKRCENPQRERERADCAEGEQHTNPQRHRPQTRADQNHGQKPGFSSQSGVTAPSPDARALLLLLSAAFALKRVLTCSFTFSTAAFTDGSFNLCKINVGVDQKLINQLSCLSTKRL